MAVNKALLARLQLLEAAQKQQSTGLSDADAQALTALLAYPGDTLPSLTQFQIDYPDIPRSVAAENLEAWGQIVELMNS